MKPLKQLIQQVPYLWNQKGDLSVPINRVQSDSRHLQPGDLFVAVSGFKADGHQYIQEVVKKGARALVVERFDSTVPDSIPQIEVTESRAVLTALVAASYDDPQKKLKIIGVTGTNGKTTTAFLIQHLINSVSACGLIGTILYDDGKKRQPADNTTPIPETLFALLNQMVRNDLKYCVMEVSSHALDQNRTAGLDFSGAIFTNLTQDHLDYHETFDQYFAAKRRLFFRNPMPHHAVINQDDSYGRRLITELDAETNCMSYGFGPDAVYRAEQLELNLEGLKFDLIHHQSKHSVGLPLTLKHNAYNALAALAAVSEEGMTLDGLVRNLAGFKGVPGRMERIDEGQDFHVFVDYAHTPDGLLNVLSSVEGIPKNRVISVFGCGGDRDKTKRPVMGQITAERSDVAIITSDNPRTEDPNEIIRQIQAGIDSKKVRAKTILVIPNREDAIHQAIGMAEAKDLVFIFGKGHEDYQVIGTHKSHFSDQEIARKLIRKKCLPSMKS